MGTAALGASPDWQRALARTSRLPAPPGALAGRVVKEMRERAAVADWAAAMAAREGLQISAIRSHPRQDAPDCLFRCKGREFTAEVTEIIDEDFAKFLSAKAREAPLPAAAPPSLTRGYWDRDTFLEKLSHRIARKTATARAHERRIDALIVTTHEPLLLPASVAGWLEGWPLSPTPHVRSGWLVMEADPAFSPHPPVFNLFGSFPPPRSPWRFFFS